MADTVKSGAVPDVGVLRRRDGDSQRIVSRHPVKTDKVDDKNPAMDSIIAVAGAPERWKPQSQVHFPARGLVSSSLPLNNGSDTAPGAGDPHKITRTRAGYPLVPCKLLQEQPVTFFMTEILVQSIQGCLRQFRGQLAGNPDLQPLT